MNENAIKQLNPTENRILKQKYSKKFKQYNANVRANNKEVVFSLSSNWQTKQPLIKNGLIQHLYCKLMKINKKTLEIEIYQNFINSLPKYAKKENKDIPYELEKSFDRINQTYFSNDMEKPNLKFGTSSTRKLGHYEYQSDTIVISNIFKKQPELLDFIMYHELLHKKHGLQKSSTGKSYIHHSTQFRKDERKFQNKNIETDLKNFIRKHKLKQIFKLS